MCVRRVSHSVQPEQFFDRSPKPDGNSKEAQTEHRFGTGEGGDGVIAEGERRRQATRTSSSDTFTIPFHFLRTHPLSSPRTADSTLLQIDRSFYFLPACCTGLQHVRHTLLAAPPKSFTFDTPRTDDNATKETAEERILQRVTMGPPTYLAVEVNAEQTFILHKSPLVEHSELLRQLVLDSDHSRHLSSPRVSKKLIRMQIDDMPGGAQGFEMAARFCYNDADFIITSANVAMLRCAAEFLRMTDVEVKGNLISKTENYMRTMVFWSWEESLTVLRSCEGFLQAAEKTQIIQRCASALADKASPTSFFAAELQSSPLHASTDSYLASYLVSTPSGGSSHRSSKAASDTWWFDELSTLSVRLMEPVVRSMITSRASDNKVLAKFLLHYLRSALPVLGYSAASLSPMKLQHGEGDDKNKFNQSEKIQREVVEVVVNLLANLDRKSVSCRSLLGLRRIAVALRAGKYCRRDLERMIGRQLEKATLDNILIPALPPRSSSLYDVDLVLRFVDFFLKEKAEALLLPAKVRRTESGISLFSARTDSRLSSLSRTDSRTSVPGTMSPEISTPVQAALLKVGELMDKYLAEIAADTYLKPSKFLALAEALPDYARHSDDGLYRAVDIYLEAHPCISETDATRLFKVLNYHKLGAETCRAAAQNPRFPPSFAIQVALVQQSQVKTRSEGSFRSDRSISPLKSSSPRAGQQTVVHLQCSSFEFTLRQNQEKKKNAKKAEPRSELQSSCKRSRVEMPAGLHRLMSLFNHRSRCH